MLRKSVLIAVIVSSPVSAAFAADCCHDFWSCAGAVATGGVSCAVEDTVNHIKEMQQRVQSIRTTVSQDVAQVTGTARHGVNDAISDLKKNAQAVQSDFTAVFQNAQQLGAAARQAPPRNLNAEAAKTDAAIRAALTRGTAEIDLLRPQLSTGINDVQSLTAQAVKQFEGQVQTANRVALTALTAPLDNIQSILNDLIKNPTKLARPDAMVDSIVKSTTANIEKTMNSMTQQLVKDANASIHTAADRLHLAQERAARARQLLQAMQNATTQRTPAAYNALAALLPGQPPLTATVVATPPTGHLLTLPPVAVQTPPHLPAPIVGQIPGIAVRPSNPIAINALNKANAVHAQAQTVAQRHNAELIKHLEGLQAKQQAITRPVLTDATISAFRRHADTMFDNLTHPQLDAKLQELLAQAKSRFATDPATLQKVVLTLNKEADEHKRKLRPAATALPTASLDTIVNMIVQGSPWGTVEKTWGSLLKANPGLNAAAAIDYISSNTKKQIEYRLHSVATAAR